MSAAVFTLDDLAIQEGDSFDVSNNQDKFKPGLAYQVHIKSVTCKETQNGYLQAELELEFSANGKQAGQQRVMLPVFTKKLVETMGQEVIHKRKQLFGRNFMSLLRACDPKNYSVYSRKDDSTRNWKFYDENDNLLSTAEKKQRENFVAAATIKAAQAVAQGHVDETPLVGADVWLVITESPSKNPQRPEPSKWQNWFAEQPEKFEAAPVSEVPF